MKIGDTVSYNGKEYTVAWVYEQSAQIELRDNNFKYKVEIAYISEVELLHPSPTT